VLTVYTLFVDNRNRYWVAWNRGDTMDYVLASSSLFMLSSTLCQMKMKCIERWSRSIVYRFGLENLFCDSDIHCCQTGLLVSGIESASWLMPV
jgi:hypothetical protein